MDAGKLCTTSRRALTQGIRPNTRCQSVANVHKCMYLLNTVR